MLGECQARPAACDAALASPERRAKDCRHWETAFERPGARRNVRVPQPKHLRGRPGVRGLRRHRPGPEGRAQSPDGRTHRLSGSPELSTPARDLVVRGFRPMRTQLLLDSTPPTRRRSTSPSRILSSESPRGRPGSPPPKSRTLEATRSRPRDQGTGPLCAGASSAESARLAQVPINVDARDFFAPHAALARSVVTLRAL